MEKIKFIVPATYDSQVGLDEKGKPVIEQVAYDNAGETVEVPADDAAHFDTLGWARVDGKKK